MENVENKRWTTRKHTYTCTHAKGRKVVSAFPVCTHSIRIRTKNRDAVTEPTTLDSTIMHFLWFRPAGNYFPAARRGQIDLTRGIDRTLCSIENKFGDFLSLPWMPHTYSQLIVIPRTAQIAGFFVFFVLIYFSLIFLLSCFDLFDDLFLNSTPRQEFCTRNKIFWVEMGAMKVFHRLHFCWDLSLRKPNAESLNKCFVHRHKGTFLTYFM